MHRSLRRRITITAFVAVVLFAQFRAPTAETIAERSITAPAPLTHYKGRRIATTMHHRGAPWLVRDDREEQERCSLMLANLGVKPGFCFVVSSPAYRA